MPRLDVAPQNQQDAEPEVAEHQEEAEWNVAEWHGRMLVDRNGERIGKLQDVYVDVETDEPQFATVKEGFIGRHLTFVPLGGIKVGPESLEAAVSRQQVQDAPNIEQHGEELAGAPRGVQLVAGVGVVITTTGAAAPPARWFPRATAPRGSRQRRSRQSANRCSSWRVILSHSPSCRRGWCSRLCFGSGSGC